MGNSEVVPIPFLCIKDRESRRIIYGGKQMEYTVNISWDNDAKVWIATSEEILGLIMESDSYEILIERLSVSIPELLKLNHQPEMSSLKCISINQPAYTCN